MSLNALKDSDLNVSSWPALVAALVPVSQRLLALADFGEKGLVPLFRALSDKDVAVRRQAAQALRWAKPKKATVAPLTRALKDQDVEVRRHAAEALGRYGMVAKKAVSQLGAA